MKLIWLLTKIRLRSLISSIFNIGRKKNPQKKLSPWLIVGITLLLVYVGFSFISLAVGISFGIGEVAIVQLSSPWFYFSALSVLTFAMMVFTGSFTAKAQIFSPKDNDLLLSMPITPRAILISRMSLLYVMDLFFCLIFMVPAGIVYLLFFRSFVTISIVGAISYILTVLLLPLLSLALSCLLGWIIAAIENRSRNKTFVQMAISVLFLAAYFLAYAKFSDIISYLQTSGEVLISKFKTALYPFYALGVACADGSILMLAFTLLFTLLPFAICFIILQRSFIRLATAKNGLKKLKYSREMSNIKSVRSPLEAMTRKEMRHFFSNSMYMMNAGIGLIMLVMGAVALPFIRNQILPIVSELGLIKDAAAAIIMVIGLYIISLVLISAPSVSLEGKNLWISLTLPVRGSVPLHAKTLSHIIISAIPIFIFSLSCVIFLPMTFFCGVLVFLIPQAFSIVIAFVGTIINARFPKFDWIDEMVAVKQSISVLLAMLLGFVILAVCGAVAVLVSLFLSVTLGLFVLFILFVALGAGLYFIEDRAGARLFAALGNK